MDALKTVGLIYLAVGLSLGTICLLVVAWIRRCDRSQFKLGEAFAWFVLPILIGPAALVILGGAFIILFFLVALTEAWDELQLYLAQNRIPQRFLETLNLAGHPRVAKWLRGWEIVVCETCGREILFRWARRPEGYPESEILCPKCAAACSSPAPYDSKHQ